MTPRSPELLVARDEGNAAVGVRSVVQMVRAVLVPVGAFLALPHHNASPARVAPAETVVTPTGPVPIEKFCRSFVTMQKALGAFAGPSGQIVGAADSICGAGRLSPCQRSRSRPPIRQAM